MSQSHSRLYPYDIIYGDVIWSHLKLSIYDDDDDDDGPLLCMSLS